MTGGKTIRKISEILKISIQYVNFHRRNLMEKFDSKNSCELIFKASREGYF